jgi:hypothetical protein
VKGRRAVAHDAETIPYDLGFIRRISIPVNDLIAMPARACFHAQKFMAYFNSPDGYKRFGTHVKRHTAREYVQANVRRGLAIIRNAKREQGVEPGDIVHVEYEVHGSTYDVEGPYRPKKRKHVDHPDGRRTRNGFEHTYKVGGTKISVKTTTGFELIEKNPRRRKGRKHD